MFTPFGNTLSIISYYVSLLVPLLLAVAIVLFFWGLVKFIANASDEAARESGKNLMIWGMIAIFVMVAFWSIIGYVQSSLGVSGNINTGSAPTVSIVPMT
ncbi:MAG: hypothetical protein A2942_01310 [Candidatus Lloydbacteria bacterium RIFCSPLOWO2_01_FULL_50_20]|uniref:Uncharacterized protein n=1 Tax=Candidatus Lloydbacteria bacterium RIFCSPLOWO2_01_FULL_50_20 TaxID=1798665 RepID=A0A1G2DIF6_9BACT|nr:MAG: hypothetical protein A3C13_00855 [Candidatus Lloydbacteria bacterium RIFCSPHIGHO2_02_FULL_50_11]OGZ13464.1 MAG: hypothetical protein A2942_01310 [Candidatus Lloydbacteria bacterium RIFCSPLOWO2_01_FULL_50_20]